MKDPFKHDYEIGDEVVCVDSNNRYLVEGEEYLVEGFQKISGDDYTTVRGVEESFFPSRFEKVKAEEELDPGWDKTIGESLEDFEVGQYVSVIKDGPRWDGKKLKIVQIGGDNRPKEHTYPGSKCDPTWVWVVNEEKQCDGFQPSTLHTAKGTEELMNCCSYCGKEGHNRRTCPEYKKAISGSGKKKKRIIMSEVPMGAKVKVFHDTTGINPFGEGIKTEEGIKWTSITKLGISKGWRTDGNSDVSLLDNSRVVDDIGWKFELLEESKLSNSEVEKEIHVWDLTEKVLPNSRLTLLYGPPGTGKTTAANFSGNPKKVCNITLTEETPAAELRGHFIPRGGEFIWMNGPALVAFEKGYRLVLNEIDKASGDALTFCHALLDDPGIARLTLPFEDSEGEPVTVFPHDDFHVIATMNGEPEDLPDALRDRFAVRIHIDKLHPEAIKALPEDLRKPASKGISGDNERSVSVRGWKAFALLRDLIGEREAAMAVFGPRAETIMNTIKISRSGKTSLGDSKKVK